MTSNGLIDLRDLKGLTIKGCAETLEALPRFCGRGKIRIPVLAHSLFCHDIAEEVYGGKDQELLLAVLTHDLPESVTNDIPTYIKYYLESITPGALKGLREIESKVLRHFTLEDAYKKYYAVIKRVDTAALVIEASWEFEDFRSGDWPQLDKEFDDFDDVLSDRLKQNNRVEAFLNYVERYSK